MDEIMEAERFDTELEKVLAGRPVASGLDPELAEDLAFAARFAALDFAGESRLKNPAKAKILAKAGENRLRDYLRRVGVRPSVLAACACALLIAPLAMKWIASDNGSGFHFGDEALQQGWSGKSAGGRGMFDGSGSSPYEPGISGLAPGGAVGGGQDVITPLDVRNPSGLVMGPDAADRDDKGGAQTTFVLPGIPGTAAPKRKSRRGVSGGKFGFLSSPEAAEAPLSREGYGYIEENPFQKVADHPLSTFSINVDGASYSNARRILNESRMPPPDAVRVEEFVNYFHYGYPEPSGEHPFSITTELAACPWNAKHKLVRVGIKGKSIAKENLPPNNLVFLIDSSGSMWSEERLPLIKKGLRLLVEQLRKEDRISIVSYAGQAGLVLPATPGDKKEVILEALDNIESGGSTAGGAGIELAYKIAADNFMKHGNNRVILSTDGDFNVGVTSDGELTRLIEEKRDHGISLTVLGVGRDNLQDHKMQQLADKGNGNYAYLDGILEAQKVLVKEMGATLLTIAKDVKIQVEFNPARVSSYKLIGYEERLLKAEDFNNDKKDAGELGAGHTVTALYEVVPAGVQEDGPASVDPLKYQKTTSVAAAPDAAEGKELLTVKFRYKKPGEDKSRLIVRPLADEDKEWSAASPDFKFAAAAAGFGLVLRGSKTKGDLDYDKVRAMAVEGLGKDEDGYRAEMIRLVGQAKLLDRGMTPAK